MKIGEDFSGLVIRTYTREVINIYNVIKVVFDAQSIINWLSTKWNKENS